MAPPSRRSSSNLFTSPIFSLLCLVYLFSSTALAASAVLGVDLGTEYIKATLVKPGIPLEIVLTKDSRRKELSAVTFKPVKGIKSGQFPERLYGSDAMALSARFPADVYPNLKALLGLSTENSVVKEYASRHPALKLESDKTRGTAAFKSSAFADDELAWSVEEILAMELQSIQKNAEALAGKGSTIRDLVITIPVFYTAEEKRAVLLAADLAGLRVLELISDGLAIGVNYATTRQFPSVTEGGTPEHHLVFDMGAGSTTATVIKFQGKTVKDVGKFNKTIQEVQVLGSGWDRTLGGDALNAAIVDDMITKFVASPAAKSVSPTVESVKKHGRAAAKLWKEAERLRQILSANANTQTGFEGLYEDVDFRYKITRTEFEKLAKPFAARIVITAQKALDAAGLHVKDLDTIILHGGAIRTPFVQKELEKFVGKADKVRGNVNSDEAAAFGAAFRGATLSPSFRVKEIRVFEGAAYAAGIKWTNIHEKPQHQRLWQTTSYVGAEKQFTFKNQKDFSINFYQHVASSENVSPGSAEKELVTLTSQNLTESVARLKEKFGCTDSDINVKLSTRLSSVTGEVEVVKFVVDCEVEATEDKAGVVDSIKGVFGFGKKDQVPLSEEESSSSSSSTTEKSTSSTSTTSASGTTSSASSSSKDAKPKPTKPAKRWEIVPIKHTLELKGLPQLPAAELKRMKDRLSAFEDSDRSRRLREESLNQLEGFTYKARELLDNEDFVVVSTPKERKDLEAAREAASEWIYSGGTDASREELRAQLKVLKDIVTPIEKRKSEAATRPEKIESLQSGLKDTQEVLNNIKQRLQNETLAIESWSSSKSAASASSAASPSTSSTTPSASPSSKTADGFEGLDDESSSTTTTTTTTSSAPPEEETPPSLSLELVELVPLQTLLDETAVWLTEKIAEQGKLEATADPVLLTKDIEAKLLVLQEQKFQVVLKAMQKAPPKPKQPTTKPKPKAKTSKTKKAKGTKTASTDKAGATAGKKKPMIKIPEGAGDLTEQDILDMIEKATAEADARAKDGGNEEIKVDEAEKKHDEL